MSATKDSSTEFLDERSKEVESELHQQSEPGSHQLAETTSRNSKHAIFSDFALRALFVVADFALYLDRQLLRVSKWLFRRLPSSVQRALRELNSTFIAGRNRAAGISQFDLYQNARRGPQSDLELQRGDVPGWVLVVLMTTGLVTALWTIAAPRLSQLLRNSLDSMNSIR